MGLIVSAKTHMEIVIGAAVVLKTLAQSARSVVPLKMRAPMALPPQAVAAPAAADARPVDALLERLVGALDEERAQRRVGGHVGGRQPDRAQHDRDSERRLPQAPRAALEPALGGGCPCGWSTGYGGNCGWAQAAPSCRPRSPR